MSLQSVCPTASLRVGLGSILHRLTLAVPAGELGHCLYAAVSLYCFGRLVVEGKSGGYNVIVGTGQNDYLNGESGTDLLDGGADDDRLFDMYSDNNVWPCSNKLRGSGGSDACRYWTWDTVTNGWEQNLLYGCEISI